MSLRRVYIGILVVFFSSTFTPAVLAGCSEPAASRAEEPSPSLWRQLVRPLVEALGLEMDLHGEEGRLTNPQEADRSDLGLGMDPNG